MHGSEISEVPGGLFSTDLLSVGADLPAVQSTTWPGPSSKHRDAAPELRPGLSSASSPPRGPCASAQDLQCCKPGPSRLPSLQAQVLEIRVPCLCSTQSRVIRVREAVLHRPSAFQERLKRMYWLRAKVRPALRRVPILHVAKYTRKLQVFAIMSARKLVGCRIRRRL